MLFGRARDARGVEHFVRRGPDGATTALSDAPWHRAAASGVALDPSQLELLAPVRPGKVVCVGRNYRAHARELGNEVPSEPLLFLKPPSAVVGPDAAIELPPQSERVEHEGELAIVVGQKLARANASRAREAIFGYTAANDVTARDIQRREGKFTRAKGFDTFCPLGPWIVAGRPDGSLSVVTRVNGAERQRGLVSDMVFGIDELLAFISDVMTLEPGDVVLTGTPEGVGPLCDGDTVEVEIPGVGALRNAARRRAD